MARSRVLGQVTGSSKFRDGSGLRFWWPAFLGTQKGYQGTMKSLGFGVRIPRKAWRGAGGVLTTF